MQLTKKETIMEMVKRVINEENITVEKLLPNTLITFKDGEQWIVVKSGLRSANNRKTSNEVTVKPYNKLAKTRNISLAIDLDIEYIKKNSVKIDYN